MKAFTLKDFISYNNPCFSCGDKIIFGIVTSSIEKKSEKAELRPFVTPAVTSVHLKITYDNTLQLHIFTPSNKIYCDNSKALADYVYSHKIFLRSTCTKCHTKIESKPLEFNLLQSFIKPVEIRMESLVVTDATHKYHIHSSYKSDKSIITMDKLRNPTAVSNVRIESPLLPLFKFKDRDHFISKMRIYLLFS